MTIPGSLTIRAESAADRSAVFTLLAAAFPGDDEARLVDRLRGRVDPFLSLVACEGDELLGYILVTPVEVRAERTVSHSSGAPPEPRPSANVWRALGLAPLAVRPDVQRCGIGGRLARAAIDASRLAAAEARRDEIAPVLVVLGHPAYYPKFGFLPAASLGLRYSQPGHAAAFFALELAPGALAGRRGFVHFDSAFDEL